MRVIRSPASAAAARWSHLVPLERHQNDRLRLNHRPQFRKDGRGDSVGLLGFLRAADLLGKRSQPDEFFEVAADLTRIVFQLLFVLTDLRLLRDRQHCRTGQSHQQIAAGLFGDATGERRPGRCRQSTG